mmetsp:Transcript_12267/g.37426  ORF Transcript_12267/g.37426 Transcript_12267/m.37426 type:complete len:338 (-) Transcript_12267:72-1085(-)
MSTTELRGNVGDHRDSQEEQPLLDHRAVENHGLWGLAAMGLSTALFSSSSIVIRYGSSALPTPYILFVRAILQIIVGIGTCAVLRKNPFGPRDCRPSLFFRGVFGFLGSSSYYFALRYLDVGDANAIIFVGPVVTILLSAIFLGEQLYFGVLAAAVCAFTGVLLITKPVQLLKSISSTGGLPLVRLLGVILCLGQALFSSFAYILIRMVRTRVHFIVNVFYFGLVVFLLVPVEGFLLGTPVFFLPKGTREWCVVIFSSVLALGGNISLSISLQSAPVGQTAAIRNLQVVFAFLLGWVFLHERPSISSVIGACIIIGATSVTAFVTINRAARKKIDRV